MKLLLTSSGIQNPSIGLAALELVNLPAEKINLCFVPTAANQVKGDKQWLIDDLSHFKDQKYETISIVDIASAPREVWLPQMEAANIICFGGGDEQYLARIMRESGVSNELPKLLETRVYMGISSGSMVAGQFLSKELLKAVYPEEAPPEVLQEPLGLVDLVFLPHLNSEYFTQMRRGIIEPLKSTVKHDVYALDDQSALKIQDKKIEVVSEGEYLKL